MVRHSGPISQRGGLSHVRVPPELVGERHNKPSGTALRRTTASPVHRYSTRGTDPVGDRPLGNAAGVSGSAPDRQPIVTTPEPRLQGPGSGSGSASAHLDRVPAARLLSLSSPGVAITRVICRLTIVKPMTTEDLRKLLPAKGCVEGGGKGSQGTWTAPSALSTPRGMTASPLLVWYVSYGSNMCIDRLTYYLSGGVRLGARRTYPGCRDRRAPLQATGYELAGGVYFATESAVWGGGRAFYDPELPGSAAARAYLITSEQFADILAQEMSRTPGENLDLATVLAKRRVELGPGRYETLLHVGDLGEYPLLTFTAPWHAADVLWTPPSPPYLRVIMAGLRETYGWNNHRIARYLARLPGARGYWTPADIAAL
jgi:hypothetical protein